MKLSTLLILVLLPVLIYAQNFDTVYVYSNSLVKNSLDLDGVWRYHPGDDSAWASPSFDVSDWDTLKTYFLINEIPEDKWEGIGWFRKVFVVDSGLVNKTIAFRLRHLGASEIYINGLLVHTYGRIGKSMKDEEIYQPNNIPIGIRLDTNTVYTIAVRYSNRRSTEDREWFERWMRRAGFELMIADLNSKIQDKVESESIGFAVNFGLAGIFLSLAILYFFLFIFYARRKENLYYSFFTFFIVILFLSGMLRNLVHSDLNLLFVYSVISAFAILFIFTSYLGFLYSIFYEKMPKTFWFFLAAAVLFCGSIFLYIQREIIQTIIPVFIFVSTFEGLRIIILAIKRKKKNAWVIGTGVIIFVILIVFVFAITLFGGGQLNSYIGAIIFIIGLLSLPMSMSIYLARDIASTNKDLEKQLENVKELSKKELEHQKRNMELELKAEKERAENERKTKELDEARQLQLSMLPKNIPQLPHLDIAVYMKTATEVGGDYYDFHVGTDGSLTVVVGDATGHGLNAGTMVTATKSLFSAYAANPDILRTFAEISRSLKDFKFQLLSMCLMLLKIDGNKLKVSSAGMPPALIYRREQREIEEIMLRGMPLGTKKGFPYELRETVLNSGDTILLMSDGFPELFDEEKNMYGYERVRNTFSETAEKSSENIIDYLRNKASEWTKNKNPDDDVTFVVIKAK